MSEQKILGRPTIYNDELAEYICTTISTTDSGVCRLCREDEKFPDFTTIQQWRFKNPVFSKMYNEARLNQQMLLAEKINYLAEECIDKYGFIDEKKVIRVDSGIASLYKMKQAALQWTSARLLPHEYGDKSTVVLEGGSFEDNLKKLKETVDAGN